MGAITSDRALRSTVLRPFLGVAMALVPRKNVLAIAAVIDIALNGHNQPVAAKALCARHRLPARHLEPVLQALVREGILKGVRGPYGGYELARSEGRQITADDILRAARTIDDGSDEPITESPLVSEIVAPVLAEAEHAFSRVLARISVADLMTNAERGARATRGITALGKITGPVQRRWGLG